MEGYIETQSGQTGIIARGDQVGIGEGMMAAE